MVFVSPASDQFIFFRSPLSWRQLGRFARRSLESSDFVSFTAQGDAGDQAAAPTGMTTASRSPCCSSISIPQVPCPRDHGLVIKRMYERQFLFLAPAQRFLAGLVVVCAGEITSAP